MKALIIMCGLPGSGKSTYINEVLLKNAGTQLVCADDVRLALGHQFNPKAEGMVHAVCSTMVRAFMERGLDVVVDETSTMPVFVAALVKTAKEYGYHVSLYRLNTSPEVCKARRAGQGDYPWNDIIDRKDAQLNENWDKLQGLADVTYTINGEG